MLPGTAGALSTLSRFPFGGSEILEEEPLYVNAKQYHRILKRRQARARLEVEGKIPKNRSVRVANINKVNYIYIVLFTRDICMNLVIYMLLKEIEDDMVDSKERTVS